MRLPTIDHLGRPVAHRRRLIASGLTPYRIRTAVSGGRWQECLPGVLVGHTGPLTQVERWQAALEYAGAAAALSHRSALLAQRARAARAAVDVAITAVRRGDVDHVVADVLQRRLCTVADLAAEAELLGRACTPALRGALADAGVGVRSVGEAELRRVVRLAGVPEPEWGVEVLTAEGPRYLDALWRKQKVAAEADGAAFHLSPEDWQDDLHRQNLVMATGLRFIRFTVSRMRADRARCAAELAAALGFRSVEGEVS